MSSHTAAQLHSIHTLFTSGQRNLRMERHSLFLWGLTAGLLFALSESILTPTQFPTLQGRAFAWLFLLLAVLGAVAAIDWHWMRQVKEARDEIWSFVHRQIIKVWWLLMGSAILLTFATFFYGGGQLLIPAWVIVAGLGLYIHGLFSEELLEWVGLMMMAIGIAVLLFGLDYQASKWVAASVFGIGMPLVSFMLDRGQQKHIGWRLCQTIFWLLAVLSLPLLVYRATLPHHDGVANTMTLSDYRSLLTQPDSTQAITLPKGTIVPVKFDVGSNIFEPNPDTQFMLTLKQPVTLLMQNGQLNGEFKWDDDIWRRPKGVGWIHIPWLRLDLSPQEGVVIKTRLEVQVKSQPQ